MSVGPWDKDGPMWGGAVPVQPLPHNRGTEVKPAPFGIDRVRGERETPKPPTENA